MDIVEKAKRFAVSAHQSIQQKRKYTNEPYFVHCERVVNILREVTDNEEILAAAWIHDVLEDVAPLDPLFSEIRLRELFGDNVADMVLALTDSKLEHGNRAARKERDRLRLGAATAAVQTIKLADILDNFVDITEYDPGFARVFAREIGLLLPFLSKGEKPLFDKLSKLLENYSSNER